MLGVIVFAVFSLCAGFILAVLGRVGAGIVLGAFMGLIALFIVSSFGWNEVVNIGLALFVAWSAFRYTFYKLSTPQQQAEMMKRIKGGGR